MSRNAGHQNAAAHEGYVAASERTPLISSSSSTTEVAAELHAKGSSDVRRETSTGSGGDEFAKQTIGTVRTILCTVALGFLIFLQATNISMLTTAQSYIADALDVFDQTTWFTSAYMIAMSSITPLSGKLASLFSPRICILVSTIVLAIGAAICSIAQSFEVFLVGRVITGTGAGGIFSLGIVIVLELTSTNRRGLAMGLLNSGYTLGVALGATLAGALLEHTGWRALFGMQVPMSLIAGFTLFFSIPSDFTATTNTRTDEGFAKRLAKLDYMGAVTLTASIVLFLYALSSPTGIPIFPIILAAIVFMTFILIEVHIAGDPIIPVTLLKSRGLLLTSLATIGTMMARWSVLFYTPTYAIAVRQWHEAAAGSMLIPTNAGFAIGGLLVGWLHIRRSGSFYGATVIVVALFPVTMIGLALLSTQHSNVALYVGVVFLNGMVTGAMLNYSLAHLLHLTPRSTHYVASALTATFRGFAGSFGSAIGGGIFTRTLYNALEMYFDDRGLYNRDGLRHRLLGAPKTVLQLKGLEREAAILGYQDALKTLFLAGGGLAIMMILVQAGTGWGPPAVEEEGSRLEDERQALVARQEGHRRDDSA